MTFDPDSVVFYVVYCDVRYIKYAYARKHTDIAIQSYVVREWSFGQLRPVGESLGSKKYNEWWKTFAVEVFVERGLELLYTCRSFYVPN